MFKFKLPKINLSIQLILIFIFVLCFGNKLSYEQKSFLFGVSGVLREGLVWCLPFIIFSCLYSCIIQQKGKALKFVAVLISLVTISNFISVIAAYFAGKYGLELLQVGKLTVDCANTGNQSIKLLPSWGIIEFKPLIKNEVALLAGLVLGLLFSTLKYPPAKNIGVKLNYYTTFFLEKIFIPILPIFALGFMVKMNHEGALSQVLETYLPIVMIILLASVVYLMICFGLVAKFKPKLWFKYMKNALPAALTGFSTMSSLAAMPVTLTAADKNTGQPEMSRAVVPATVNMHLIGDSMAITIFALAILVSFTGKIPSFSEYLIFSYYFVIYKYAIAAVPGGSIIVILPLLQEFLGFNGPDALAMSGMITALYILFDPLVTAVNVMGNSAFAILMANIFKRAVDPKRK